MAWNVILKLLGMIILGIVSAALSYYKKNYYVRIFDDILGKEEDEKTTVRVGRGFLYGFLFPIYFVLLLIGLVSLIVFLIIGGIIGVIVFVMVWITEKLLPHEWFGTIMLDLFKKVGMRVDEPAGGGNPCCAGGTGVEKTEA